jgi:D-glycero-alpha-D-manno-heptose 1-phosphate guanylyltransferase
MTAVVLAGGLGTRIKHLVPDLPKPMVPVRARPFMEWVIGYLRHEGIGRVLISTGHLGEAIERHFAAQPTPGVALRCFRESAALGTAGGFLHAVRSSGEQPDAWLVLNGDSLAFADLEAAATELNEPQVQGVVVGVSMPDTSRYGRIALDQTGRLLQFEEKQPGSGVINAGIYAFKPELLSKFPTKRPLSFEQDVFPQLLAQGTHLQVSVTAAPFLDIGTPESLLHAEAFIEQNLQLLQSA